MRRTAPNQMVRLRVICVRNWPLADTLVDNSRDSFRRVKWTSQLDRAVAAFDPKRSLAILLGRTRTVPDTSNAAPANRNMFRGWTARLIIQQIKTPGRNRGLFDLRRVTLFLLAALSGLLVRLLVLLATLSGLLVLLIRPLLATALLTAALLVLLSTLILIVLGHRYLQFFCEILLERHHSTNPP
jgi:hypothetical protein